MARTCQFILSKKINFFGLIFFLNFSSKNKNEICVEVKIIKKTCLYVKTEIELLSLIQTNLKNLKRTMTKKGKKYYVIFIDNFSRYTKLYLFRSKDETYKMFLLYKAEVKNQLNKKNRTS